MNNHYARPRSQQGGALLIFVLILVLAGTAALFSSLDGSDVKLERDRKTAESLAKARSALIGWSVSRGVIVPDRPGELPCPDTDGPNSAGYGDEEGTCTAGKVGRLPWRTLGIEELTDGYGEPLWYAIDGSFRKRWGATPSTNQPINSDTLATMKIYATDGLTLITGAGYEAAAVIFSAGYPLDGQSRSSTNIVPCLATGTNLAENRCASNYLEAKNGRNNALNNGPFIKGTYDGGMFNDRLVYVKASELVQIVEKRVGKELQGVLQNYFTTNGYYPYPAKYDLAGCMDVGNLGYMTDCQSDVSICRGRLPDMALPNDWSGANLLPAWFTFNLWGQTIYYSVGGSALDVAPASCNSLLSVDVVNNKSVVYFMSGAPLGGTVRNNPTQNLNLSDYLESPENADGWGALANDDYSTPLASSNDRLFSLP